MPLKRTDLKIPYGISDFKRIRNEGLYYVDKTEYLARLEERDSFVFFVRPRRFGKSLFISMMQSYYDRREKGNFEKLFGGLWLGEHPTENRNKYLVLALDLSKAGASGGKTIAESFESYIAERLLVFVDDYPDVFDREFRGEVLAKDAQERFTAVVGRARSRGFPIYLIIDEYDNFTNSLIRSAGKEPYKSITHGTGFYRQWFKQFKGDVDRIFMTGVSPVTMDDLTSGFNIAANVSQDGDVRDSYIIELKHSRGDASDAELAAKAEEGIAQLHRYAADPTVPALAKDTRLHLILYQFKGTELIRCEEIPSRSKEDVG